MHSDAGVYNEMISFFCLASGCYPIDQLINLGLVHQCLYCWDECPNNPI